MAKDQSVVYQQSLSSFRSRKLSLISRPCDGVSSQNPGLLHCASAWNQVTDDSVFSLEEVKRPEASPERDLNFS